jgi:murein DD-endopeptidase MepM/ murein hydrolase activator NlpD
MQRLVYSPSVKVWVKSDSGVVDLSPYVTDCRIIRKVNEKSSAEVTFRNPKVNDLNGKNRFMWTQHEYTGPDGVTSVRPVFHPMDPITIVFERIAGRPIQVFTGYCDKTPYVQLFPGLAKITASCTLKRLDYTYWDPALEFSRTFMKNYGWDVGPAGQAVNEKQSIEAEKITTSKKISAVKLNDSGMGNLVYAVLNEVGGWNPSNIFIQALPRNISNVVSNLFDEFNKDNNKSQVEEVQKLLRDLIGNGAYGNSSAGGGQVSGGSTGNPGGGKPASVGYPLAIRGVLGSNVADHKKRPLGDWQSDNALDISVPEGTLEFAVDDGEIIRVGGYYIDGSEGTEGLKFTLKTKDNEWFYQHSKERFVHEGQKVKKGDTLAKTGSGAGVPHLHIGCKNGDPQVILGL